MNSNGDLWNSPLPRVLVHIDVVTKQDEGVFGRPDTEVPRMKKLGRKVRELLGSAPSVREPDLFAVSALWTFAERQGVEMELFAGEVDDNITPAQMTAFIDHLDDLRAHPFRGGTVYPELGVLVQDLAYRQDIIRIIDFPDRGLLYGGRWMDARRAI